MLTRYYPGMLGAAVLYQAPRMFEWLFAAIKPLLDPTTASKIVVISGDVSRGSPNDTRLVDLIGSDWRERTGCEQPVLSPGCTSGFVHESYWQSILDRDQAWGRQLASDRACSLPGEWTALPARTRARQDGDRRSDEMTPELPTPMPGCLAAALALSLGRCLTPSPMRVPVVTDPLPSKMIEASAGPKSQQLVEVRYNRPSVRLECSKAVGVRGVITGFSLGNSYAIVVTLFLFGVLLGGGLMMPHAEQLCWLVRS